MDNEKNFVTYYRALFLVTITSVFFFSTSIKADTTVPAGPVSGTWSLSNSPYIVQGDITISGTLIIESGVEIKFFPGVSMQCNGTLMANGTAGSQILFTSNELQQNPGDWVGIELSGSSDTQLSWCVIEYAIDGITCEGDSPSIADSTIRFNSNSGIYVRGHASGCSGSRSTPSILRCHIANNTGSGILYSGTGDESLGCDPIQTGSAGGTLQECRVNNNGGSGVYILSDSGYLSVGVADPTITDNDIYNNHGYGIYIAKGDRIPLTIQNNEIYQNDKSGIFVNAGNIAQASVVENKIYNNAGKEVFNRGNWHFADLITNVISENDPYPANSIISYHSTPVSGFRWDIEYGSNSLWVTEYNLIKQYDFNASLMSSIDLSSMDLGYCLLATSASIEPNFWIYSLQTEEFYLIDSNGFEIDSFQNPSYPDLEGLIFDGEFLWARTISILIKIDTTGNVIEEVDIQHDLAFLYGLAFDGDDFSVISASTMDILDQNIVSIDQSGNSMLEIEPETLSIFKELTRSDSSLWLSESNGHIQRVAINEGGSSVTGQIVSPSNSPLENVCVNATSSCGEKWYGQTLTDDEGNYQLYVPVGNYYISANPSCLGIQNYAVSWWRDSHSTQICNDAQPVAVNMGAVTTGIDITPEIDLCLNDPNKNDPGECGCGVPDTDTDVDGTPDCNDSCQDDPNKIDPGHCGCGVTDVDTDSDGWLDCNDLCPNDPDKILPGNNGCGISEDDGGDGGGDGGIDCFINTVKF